MIKRKNLAILLGTALLFLLTLSPVAPVFAAELEDDTPIYFPFVEYGEQTVGVEADNIRILLYRTYLQTGGYDQIPLPDINLVVKGKEIKLSQGNP